MLNYLRYALAAVCFTACVGCLTLWWRSVATRDIVVGLRFGSHVQSIECFNGRGIYEPLYRPLSQGTVNLRHSAYTVSDTRGKDAYGDEWFGRSGNALFFPLWYPALIFALAGVGVLRFRRQFSIRSALICVSVVAALLGMAVAL